MAYLCVFLCLLAFFFYASTEKLVSDARGLGILDLLTLTQRRIIGVPVLLAPLVPPSPLLGASVTGLPAVAYGNMQKSVGDGQTMPNQNNSSFSPNYYGTIYNTGGVVGGLSAPVKGDNQSAAKYVNYNGLGTPIFAAGKSIINSGNNVNLTNSSATSTSNKVSGEPNTVRRAAAQQEFYNSNIIANQNNSGLKDDSRNGNHHRDFSSLSNASTGNFLYLSSSVGGNENETDGEYLNEITPNKSFVNENLSGAKLVLENEGTETSAISITTTATVAKPARETITGVMTVGPSTVRKFSEVKTATTGCISCPTIKQLPIDNSHIKDISSQVNNNPYAQQSLSYGMNTSNNQIYPSGNGSNIHNQNGILGSLGGLATNAYGAGITIGGPVIKSRSNNNSNFINNSVPAVGLIDGLLGNVAPVPLVESSNSLVGGMQDLNSKLYKGSKKVTGLLKDFSNYKEQNKDDTLVQFLNKIDDVTKAQGDNSKSITNFIGSAGNTSSNSNTPVSSDNVKNPFDFSSFEKALPEEIKQQIGPKQEQQLQVISKLLGSGFGIATNFLGGQQKTGNINKNNLTPGQQQFYGSVAANNNVSNNNNDVGNDASIQKFYNLQQDGNHQQQRSQQQKYNVPQQQQQYSLQQQFGQQQQHNNDRRQQQYNQQQQQYGQQQQHNQQQQQHNQQQQQYSQQQQYNQLQKQNAGAQQLSLIWQQPQEQQYKGTQLDNSPQLRQAQQILLSKLTQLDKQSAYQDQQQQHVGLNLRKLQDSFLEEDFTGRKDSLTQQSNQPELSAAALQLTGSTTTQITQQATQPVAEMASQTIKQQQNLKQNQQQFQKQFQRQNQHQFQQQNQHLLEQENLQQYQLQTQQQHQLQNQPQNQNKHQQNELQYHKQNLQQYQQQNQQYHEQNQQYQKQNQQHQRQIQQDKQNNQQDKQNNQQDKQQIYSCYRENVKLTGKAFLVVSENSVEGCQSQCKLIISCKFFYVRLQQNMCYLFDNFTGLMSEADSIAGPQFCPNNTQSLSSEQIVQPIDGSNLSGMQYENGNAFNPNLVNSLSQQAGGILNANGLIANLLESFSKSNGGGALSGLGVSNEPLMAGQQLGGALGSGLGGAGLLGGIASAGDFFKTSQAIMEAGSTFMNAFPVTQLWQAGQTLSGSGFFRNKGMTALSGAGLEKQNALPPPGVGTPKVTCAAQGMTCCVPEKAVDDWKTKPPYLNGNSDSPTCRAHFVSLQNALCATTSYNDENCDLIKTETEDYIIYQHTLTLPARSMNNAICECRIPKKENEEGMRQVEEFSTWEFSKQAINATEEQNKMGEKVAKGLGTAMAFTNIINKQGSQAINDIDNVMTNGSTNSGGSIVSNISNIVGAITSAANVTGAAVGGAGTGGSSGTLRGFESRKSLDGGGGARVGRNDLNISSAHKMRMMNQETGPNDIIGSFLHANDIIKNSSKSMQKRQQLGLP